MKQNQQWRSIGPHDLLSVGTPVMVGESTGKVEKAEMVNAHNGGKICLHTIRFLNQRVETRCAGETKISWKRINPAKVREVNYSFIQAYI